MSADVVDPSLTASLTELTSVAEVRAEQLREAGLGTPTDVAEADVDEIAEVEGFGETRSKQVKGSAQGLVNAYEEATADASRPVSRVAVVIGDGTFGNDQGQEARKAVDTALEMAGVSVDEDLTLGFVEDTADLSREPVGDMGGNAVAGYIEFQQRMGTLVDRHAFPTPWEKYEPIFGWYDDDAEVLMDEDKPIRPDEAPPLHEIPFDTPRGYQDVESGWPAKERNQALVAWADLVVAIDGEYLNGILQQCLSQHVPVEHFELQLTGAQTTVTQYTDPEVETPGIDESDAIAGRAGTKVTRDGNGDLTVEKVDAEDWAKSKQARAGSPDDMETDEALEEGVQARDEHWPESEHHDGKGIGSNSDRTGEYPNAHL